MPKRLIHITLSTFLVLIVQWNCSAQTSGVYLFNQNFEEKEGELPPLKVHGTEGRFVQDSLPELGSDQTWVYEFEKNSGLSFDNGAAHNLISKSYSIELYFKFSRLDSWKRVIDFKNRKTDSGAYIYNGKVNFYKLKVSEQAPIRPDEYTHYIITRDSSTSMVWIYADGLPLLSFEDYADLAIPDNDQLLNFFIDDLIVQNEASSGAVAMIKFFDRSLPPAEAEDNFVALGETVFGKENYHPKLHFKARVLDKKTKKPVMATVSLHSFDEVIWSDSVHSDGTIQYVIPKPENFKVEVKAKGYLFYQEDFSISKRDNELHQKFFLTPIAIGEAILLSSIQFQQGKFDLLPESFDELDRLAEMMDENPSMKIEIHGHTDNTGSEKLNEELSKHRVSSVVDYLKEHGIKKKRLIGIGHGGAQPIADNSRENTRKLNRRVEFIVTEF